MSKVWLVTGCSRGLGRELAQAVLAAGHRLVATARDPHQLGFLTPSERLRTVALDVVDATAARAAVAAATSSFGRLDVVVNNAGYIKANSVEDLPEDEFRRQIEINLFGVYNVTRAALPVMHAQRDGHLIQISSIGGRRGTPGLGGYQAAKWAVGGFGGEVLAREVAPLGIRVTCVEPGGMRTDMFGLSMLAEPLAPDYEPTVGAVIRGTFGRPEGGRSDPARVVRALILRLADEQSSSPVHLLLGSDAVSVAAAAPAARADEDAALADAQLVDGPHDGLGDAPGGGAAGRSRAMQKVLLVTGGGRGIGAATARLAAKQGYAVCVNYRTSRGDDAKRVVREIEAGGGLAIAVQADISLDEDVARMFEACDRRLGVAVGVGQQRWSCRASVTVGRDRHGQAPTGIRDQRVRGVRLRARSGAANVDQTWRRGRGHRECLISCCPPRVRRGVRGLRGLEGRARDLHARARARGGRGRHPGQRGSAGLHLHGDARERWRAPPRRPREGVCPHEARRGCRRGCSGNSLAAVR